MARSFDSLGLGGMIGAGPVYDQHRGLAPSQILAEGWYHYTSYLVGGIGMEISSRTPTRLEAYTRNRYDLTATWIPHRTQDKVYELSLVFDVTRQNGYIDTATTAPGAHAVEDLGTDLGLALRFGSGRRFSKQVGGWVAFAPGVSGRLWGLNQGSSLTFDGEAGLTFSLHPFWSNSTSLTRSWDIFVRAPVRIESGTPTVGTSGPRRTTNWSLGLQIGPAALF